MTKLRDIITSKWYIKNWENINFYLTYAKQDPLATAAAEPPELPPQMYQSPVSKFNSLVLLGFWGNSTSAERFQGLMTGP